MTQPNDPIVINLDAITPAPAVFIQVDGKRHALAPVSVKHFVQNLKALDRLGRGALTDEIDIFIEIVLRGFPTLTREQVEEWPVSNLQKVALLARSSSGEIVGSAESVEQAQKPGNSQPAT